MCTAERIRAERVSPADGTRQLLVRWEGYTETDDTWEPEANILDARLIENFEAPAARCGDLAGRRLAAALLSCSGEGRRRHHACISGARCDGLSREGDGGRL